MIGLGRAASFIAVHGFLGLSTDWIPILGPPGIQRRYPSFNQSPRLSFTELAKVIYRQALLVPEPRILVGYSMGGRLALHALTQFPEVFAGAIIVSAHPGLGDDDHSARLARLQADETWSRRFLQENCAQVVDSWNQQSVLQGSSVLVAQEERFSRRILADFLTQLSLGLQADLRPRLKGLALPVLWMGGERDARFVPLMAEMQGLQPRFSTQILADAGHRLIWDQPQAFLRIVEDFVRRDVLG